MANPKHRRSKSKTRMGRSHHFLKAPSLATCPNCGEMMMPHRACPACGFYKGRQVLEVS